MKTSEMDDKTIVDVESLSGLRVAELREMLTNRGLPASGSKDELVRRLREAIENEENYSDKNADNPPETSDQKNELEVMQERKDESEEKLNQLMAIMMQMNGGINSKFGEMKSGMGEMKSGIEETKCGINLVSNKVESIGEEIKILEKRTHERFESVDRKLEKMEEQFEKKMSESTEKGEEKFASIGKKIEKMDEEFKRKVIESTTSIDRKFEKFEQEIEKKLSEKFSKSLAIPREIMATENEMQCIQNLPTVAKPSIKLSTYDGKTSWQVYKTQFDIVAEANNWDSITKARQLAASLRAEAADILRTMPEHQRTNFEALSDALELRFGEKCLKDYSRLQLKTRQQRANETLQELATDVERLSHLAFSDCPAEIRETLALQYFVDGVRDTEIQKALRMAELKDLKSALIYAMKFEAAQQASRKDRYSIRGAEVQQHSDPVLDMMKKMMEELREVKKKQEATSNKNGQKKARCWKCGNEGHLQRQCRVPEGQRTGAPIRNVQEN